MTSTNTNRHLLTDWELVRCKVEHGGSKSSGSALGRKVGRGKKGARASVRVSSTSRLVAFISFIQGKEERGARCGRGSDGETEGADGTTGRLDGKGKRERRHCKTSASDTPQHGNASPLLRYVRGGRSVSARWARFGATPPHQDSIIKRARTSDNMQRRLIYTTKSIDEESCKKNE